MADHPPTGTGDDFTEENGTTEHEQGLGGHRDQVNAGLQGHRALEVGINRSGGGHRNQATASVLGSCSGLIVRLNDVPHRCSLA